jgi:hypothetical protein
MILQLKNLGTSHIKPWSGTERLFSVSRAESQSWRPQIYRWPQGGNICDAVTINTQMFVNKERKSSSHYAVNTSIVMGMWKSSGLTMELNLKFFLLELKIKKVQGTHICGINTFSGCRLHIKLLTNVYGFQSATVFLTFKWRKSCKSFAHFKCNRVWTMMLHRANAQVGVAGFGLFVL